MRAVLLFSLASALYADTALFNGRDLAGWAHEGPRATFSAQNGELRTSGAGNEPNWLHTDREYENFRLTFEYKLAQWAEAAVVLRAPRLGRPMQAGIALYLAHDFHQTVDTHVTGAIAGVLPPKTPQPESWGVWHRVAIDLDGNRLKAEIDGAVVQDVDLSRDDQLRWRLRRGYIGFPDEGYAYSLRNIRIEDRGFRETYIDLFDGKSLDGWRLRGGGNWSVANGRIVGANGHGILYAAPTLQDFELTALVLTHNRVNSGIFLRGSPDLKQPRGFEVQIYSPLDTVYPTGSVYGRARANITGNYEERWFVMQIIVRGPECIVRLDGVEVARYNELPDELQKPGQVGLQIHMEDASVEFQDVRVRRL